MFVERRLEEIPRVLQVLRFAQSLRGGGHPRSLLGQSRVIGLMETDSTRQHRPHCGQRTVQSTPVPVGSAALQISRIIRELTGFPSG
jgi:hypothetical protein